jgi:hypothetical protein
VLALPFAALIDRVRASRWRWPALTLALFLLGVNLFQIRQYNLTVLHYDDMNRAYYRAIYLNPEPTPLDFSLLDVTDMPEDRDHLVEVASWRSGGSAAEGSTVFQVPRPVHGAEWA